MKISKKDLAWAASEGVLSTEQAEQLWIRFGKDGAVEAEGYYEGVDFATAESFASASSAGGWLHDHGFIKGRDFHKV